MAQGQAAPKSGRSLTLDLEPVPRAPPAASLHTYNRQWVSENEFTIQKYLNMVNAKLLELDSCKQIDVRYISFQFFEFEVDVGFRNDFDLLRIKDARCLAKFANTVAPTSPNTEFQKTHG